MPHRARWGSERARRASGVQRVLEVSETTREVHQHLLGELRDFPQELPEIRATDHEDAQVGLRLHRGRARLAVQQAHLAEELARAETMALVHRDRHQRRTVDDDEELVPRSEEHTSELQSREKL